MSRLYTLLLIAGFVLGCAEAAPTRRDAGPPARDAQGAETSTPGDSGGVVMRGDAAALGGVVINEANPAGTDWVELFNPGSAAVNLGGFKIADLDGTTGGPKLAEAATLPAGTSIAAGGYLLLASDTAAPGTRLDTCPASLPAPCYAFGFGLSGSGDEVFLLDASDAVLTSFVLPANMAGTTTGRFPNGTGSPVATAPTPSAANQLPGDAGPVPDAGPTPDAGPAADTGAPTTDAGATGLGTVVINEINPHAAPGDYIELFNPGSAPVSVGGLVVADLNTMGGPKLPGTIIPAGTTVPAGGYLVFADNNCLSGTVSGCIPLSFGLNDGGDAVFILDAQNNILDRVDLPALAPTPPNSPTWGRLPNGTGAFANNRATPNAANAAP